MKKLDTVWLDMLIHQHVNLPQLVEAKVRHIVRVNVINKLLWAITLTVRDSIIEHMDGKIGVR